MCSSKREKKKTEKETFLQDEPMKKLIDSFAKDMGWNEKATKLLFDGEVVAPMTTPDDLGLEDDDILDASSK